jgi:hypothetical protein
MYGLKSSPLAVGLSLACLGLTVMAHQPHPGHDMNSASFEKPEFFARVNYYTRPIRAELPISRSEAEAREAFYVFFRSAGKVVRAEQWLVLRDACDGSRKPPARLAAGVHLFTDDGHWSLIPSLEAIAFDAPYLLVTVGNNGEAESCERVIKQRILRHSYSYHDNGTLSRLTFETGAGSGGEDFDEAGQRRN